MVVATISAGDWAMGAKVGSMSEMVTLDKAQYAISHYVDLTERHCRTITHLNVVVQRKNRKLARYRQALREALGYIVHMEKMCGIAHDGDPIHGE